MLKKLLGESAFKLAGWTYHVEPDVLENKQVIVGFEHTSMMDAVLSLALFQIYDMKIHTLIKRELFKGPMKPLLEAIGGIAVDRKSNKDIVSVMVEHFQQNEKFNLVIAPEATRAKTGETRRPIRTGFWHIAKAAGVPIVLMYANSNTKQGGILGKIYPTEINHDLALLKQLYKDKVGLDIVIPEPKKITEDKI
ncbi:1-acyl-sn-glycerol-3-phosphate acyltransferase [Acinetobacter sp. ANC 3781]|jgi:1-acyl-sn-glycerol-3-phosphate acyltransferase|uniref:1-acyl-sn-glycerol-3-phosphate acyltransferase n=1 Tax=Acinetobacter sp. ANC 3781 TaxID=2529835 RepID=UPI00103C5FF6|nr:1-acyl-sn-glycerol-3-phosphate acyltransferase [Acinetobacter sp. ANC 3781]TCB80060.1 acyltransferase [Acinetobacter sp. ANC 3781]